MNPQHFALDSFVKLLALLDLLNYIMSSLLAVKTYIITEIIFTTMQGILGMGANYVQLYIILHFFY